jgi:hypothetical protein
MSAVATATRDTTTLPARRGLEPGEQLAPGVTFEYGDASEFPQADSRRRQKFSGEYVGVTAGVTANAPPTVTHGKDMF